MLNVHHSQKKVPEFGFSISLQDSSKTLDDVDQQNVLDVFSKMLGACANVEKRLAEQYIEMSDGIDNRVIQNVQAIVDKDLPALIKVKNQLTSCILDLDTAKTKLKNNQQIPSKVDALREEVEQAEMKMEQCRDTFETEVYSFFSREAEFCGIFLSMLEQQANYHRQCSEVFDRILPTIKQDIVSKAQRPVFGCSLTEHLHYTKREIAGVFRLAPSTSRVKKLKAEFDANMVNINEFVRDAACLSGVLKQYLRELPEPLMLHDLCEQWVQAYQKPQNERLNALWVIVDKLKQKNIGHYNNLRYLIKFLALVASHSEKNKMSSANLAIVVAPNLLWPPDNNSSNNVNNNHHQPSQHNSFAVKEAFLASKPSSSSSSSSSHDVFATSSGDPFPRALRPPPPTPIKNPPLPPHSKRKGMAPLPPSMTSSDPGWVGNNHQRSLSTSVNLQGEIAGDKGANNRFAVINGSLASSSTDISTSQLSVASSSASNNNNNSNNNSSINRSNNSSENAYQTLGAGVMGVTNVGMAICGGKELTSSHKPDDNNNIDDVMDNNNYSDITDNNDNDVTHGVVKRKGKIKSTTNTVNRSNNTNVLNRLKEINNNINNNAMNDGNETDSLAAQWKDVLDYDNAESDMINLDGDDDEAAGEGNFVRNRFVMKAENVNNKFVKNVATTSSTSAATATQPSATSSTAAATTSSSSSSSAAAASSSSQMSMSDNCAMHSPAGDADVFHPLPDASASSTGLPQQQPQQNQQHQLQQKQQQQSLPYFFISTDTTATTISTSKMSNNFNSDNKNNNNNIDNSQQTDDKRQHRPQQHTTITKPIPAPRVLLSSSTTTTTTSSSLITSSSAAAATTTSSTSSITSSTTSTNVVTSMSTTASSSTPQASASTTTTTPLAITNQSKLSLHPITSNNKDDIIIKIKKDDNDDYDDYLVENVTKL
ncbi:hypothetical protein HELRODRAFT_164475 [Helobdella robusta]|uniref:Rho-GAP domain-containing protein n=1 Tax=Helobdella robusta TaxID=6412 RepID=T1EVH0_HELRO|nr:hypothetical protein HELRODRAFT_164475 [Helobdella robusta]ESN94610.1 hypothetical protein HELRODRAFT_164475 [Helobdella robusta]